MIPWYLPTQAQLLMRRWLSLRAMILALVILGLLVTEFRLNWIEAMLGRYLVSTNDGRPQSGAIWDQGQQSQMARETLATYMDQRQAAQREARQATTMGQVVGNLDNGGTAMISAAHFIELYLKLPPVLANELISPYALLSQLSSGQWQRVYFDRKDDQLHIFFLDAGNQVLQQMAIGTSLLTQIQRGEVAINGRLEQLSDLGGEIYPAERFFSALNNLPPDVQKAVIANPEDLLRVSGDLVRVGISSNAYSDTVDLGFEIRSAQGTKVLLMQARRGAVREVQRALSGESGFQWPGSWGARP
jgi:hypothetical protein